MGFLSRISGFDNHLAAINIILANKFYDSSSSEEKYDAVREIVRVQRQIKGRGAGELREILRDLDSQPRTVQMQFIALACRNMGVTTEMKTIDFYLVENPYRAKHISDEKILDTARVLSRQTHVSYSWPGMDQIISFTRLAQTKGASDQHELRP